MKFDTISQKTLEDQLSGKSQSEYPFFKHLKNKKPDRQSIRQIDDYGIKGALREEKAIVEMLCMAKNLEAS